MRYSEQQLDQAIAWHVGLSDDEADWDGFTQWLEADPAHRAAYDIVASCDARLNAASGQIGAALPANDDAPVQGRWYQRGGMIAGVLALLLAVPVAIGMFRDAGPVVYETGKGEHRVIAMGDGARIVMDGGSRLLLHGGDVPVVELAAGAAYFDAPPDARPSFDVRVGNYRITDIGTRFDVARSGDMLAVSVAEGSVSVAQGRTAPTMLRYGQRLGVDMQDGEARVDAMDPANVASWRTGRLVYDNMPISLVIIDIERYTGVPMQLDPAIRDQRFSGVLEVGSGSDVVGSFEQITGMRVAHREDGLHVEVAR